MSEHPFNTTTIGQIIKRYSKEERVMSSELEKILTDHYGIVQQRDYELTDKLVEAIKGRIPKRIKPISGQPDIIYESICKDIDLAYASLKGGEIIG